MASLTLLPLLLTALPAASAPADDAGARWLHPAGIISRESIAEMKEKCARYVWARETRDDLLKRVERWVAIPMARLRELTPRRRTNVYHNFSCPEDRARLTFDPFDDRAFTCPRCRKSYPPETDPRVYRPGNAYKGTMYDGWGCLFFQAIADATQRLGLAYQLTGEERYARRAAEILLWFAERTPAMPRDHLGSYDITAVRHDLPESAPLPTREPNAGYGVIFTYHREGDNKMLTDFATAFELVRDAGVLSAAEQRRVQHDFLKPFCDDVVRDPEYRTDWNNVHQWLLCVMQVGVALEDRDYLDYVFGLGDYTPEKKPLHRSMAYIARRHFLPDGAFWELCSGYHLYPLIPYARTILAGRGLARQEPRRFPAAQFDGTDPRNPDGNVMRRALRWYLALALPDYTMTMLGDSDTGLDSLKHYDPLAEIGYRWFGIDEAAYYPEMGKDRRLWGLIYGAGEIERRPIPFRSARLSSGFAALRQEVDGDRIYAGINAMLPGGSHQHADRLALITYARDRLLARTKGVPYNDSVIRADATQSFAHNTVTVDKRSQRRGDLLRGEEVPRIRYFQANPELQYAEAWGDHIYPQTTRYRRAVLLLDGVILDLFDIAGGATHDWLYHCDGEELRVELPLAAGKGFDPQEYLTGGSSEYRHARTEATWSAVWTLAPEPDAPYPGRRRAVQHRLTMLGDTPTEVFSLQTYPVMKQPNRLAGVTHTLLARRTPSVTPFMSVLDTYHDQPRVRSVTALPVDAPGAAALRLVTPQGERLIAYNPHPDRELHVRDGTRTLRLKGHLVVVRLGADGKVAGAMLVDGTEVEYGEFALRAEARSNVCLTRGAEGTLAATVAADLAYETVDGERVWAACETPRVTVTEGGRTARVSVEGNQ